jgi:hypothetical protein
MNNRVLLKDKHSGNENHDSIIITECLSPECSGYYTDTISESIVIHCKSQRHNQESSGAHGEKNQVE